MTTLTPKQANVYEWIYQFTRRNGYQPTIREIGTEFGIGSPNGVVGYFTALEKKGYIHRANGDSRALKFIKRPNGKEFKGFVSIKN